MRVITDPFAVNGGARIEFDSFDGFMFATRPNASWPVSELRHGPDNKALTINADGDLIDEENIPEETSAAEVSAFIEYALTETFEKVAQLLLIEQRKAGSDITLETAGFIRNGEINITYRRDQ